MSKTAWSPQSRSIALLAGVFLLAAGVASAGQAREPLSSTDQLRVDRTAALPSGGLAQLEYLTEEWAPFNYAQNGVAAGVSVDILQAALRYAGADPSRLNVRIVPLAEGLRAAQRGPGKVLFAIARTPARAPLYKWAGPFTKASFVLYAPTRNNVRIAAPGDLGQYRIGAVTSSVENDLLASRGVDPTRIVNRATPAELLNMLEQGQIDLWATGDLAGRHQMLRTAANPNAFEVVHTLSENDLYYVFSRDVPDSQVDAFQQALRAVRDLKDAHGVSEYERVIYRNLGVGCARQTFTDASVVALVEATGIDIAGDAPATLRHINARQAPYRDASARPDP